MSDDSNIQVTFGAQIQGLLDGMGKAQDSVKEATEGMSGSITKMAETMASLGPAALGLAAVGFAFEGIKKSIEYVDEAMDSTKELAEQFKVLGYATGATNEQMNHYTAAIEMSGGTTANLQSLMIGMQRGIKANSDALIANGVAANKAALDGMSFEDYLKRVHEIAEKMATPTEREQFLIMALGRSGAMAGAMLGEFVENLEKTKGAMIISPAAMVQLEESKRSIGALKIAQQEYAASVSASATPIANFFRDIHTWYVQNLNDSNKRMEAYQKERALVSGPDAARETQHAQGMSGSVEGPATQHLKQKPSGGAEADPAIAAAKDAYEKTKILLEQGVADERITEEEKTQALIEAVKVREAAELAAHGQTAAQKLAVTRSSENEMAQLQVTATNQAKAAIDKALADQTAAQEKAAQQVSQMAKETAREQMAAGKDALAAQKATLDQEVSMGQISSAQELAQRKALIQAEEQLNLQAKDAEIADEKKGGNDPVKLQQLANQKVDIERKGQAQITELNSKAAKQQQQTYHQLFQAMTSGFSSSISGLIHGTMTWGQAFKNVLNSALDGLINFFVQWGIHEAIQWATSIAMGATSRTAEATGAAAVYAVNAMASVAAIPVYGWVAAPAAGAEAYGAGLAMAGMASSAGGWDQVPSDQVAQIHKNEMVMSAPLATGIRNMVANGQGGSDGKGGQGGGGNSLHVQTMDAKSFGKWLNKAANKRALGGTLGGMFRNGATR